MSSANAAPFRIHPDTQIAHIELQVVDLANMIAFYGGLMGFQVIDAQGEKARLSATGRLHGLLTLVERKDARPQPSNSFSPGLYHTAFRFTGRRQLATTLMRIVASGWPLQGASDHRVSEAIYLADPEGNGIEIYRDRPREEWPRLQESITMGNLPLDLHRLLDEAGKDAAQTGQIDSGTDIGHIHLQVSNLATAHAFYHDLLGLDLMMNMPTALFMSAGGYHHHVGANTWHSLNAPRREDDVSGLRSYAFTIPGEAGWLKLFERLQKADQELRAIAREGRLGVSLEDQDGIHVELLTAESEPVRKALASLRPAAGQQTN